MKCEPALPVNLSDLSGQVVMIEVERIGYRDTEILELLKAQQDRAHTWLLSCDFGKEGPWAGINAFFQPIVEDLVEKESHLLARHSYELVQVLPELRRTLTVENPNLTDLASPEERVRNYPADRAFRIVHGLIDLLSEWKSLIDAKPWVIACAYYDSVSHIGHCFFRELMRRLGTQLPLTLLVIHNVGKEKRIWTSAISGPHRWSDAIGEIVPCFEKSFAEHLAMELEDRVGDDRISIERHLGDLIRFWKLAGHPERAFKWEIWGLETYNLLGLYEDSLVYGTGAWGRAQEYEPGNDALLWRIFVKLFTGFLALSRLQEAHALARAGLEQIKTPGQRAQLYYFVAMLYARFLPERDTAAGEEYLEQGLRELERANIGKETFYFQHGFNRNGLAMIRFFQGRYEEAIDLCRSGYEQLQSNLDGSKHRLHRSVLIYNIAQVYAVLGLHKEAVEYFSAAIELDVNYSEYYNERGNLFLKIGDLEPALSDYLRAIELSPPYHEVYANLGQCYRLMGRAHIAVEAYSRALDLFPGKLVPLLGRAHAYEELGRSAEAIADYTAALEVNPNCWEALACRAVLQYEARNLDASLSDLNRAIVLAPEVADLYQNRSVALADLCQFREARQDLSSYLQFSPEAQDRMEVEQRIKELEAYS